MIRFTIAYPPTRKGKAAWNKRFGLNAYYAGKHWAKRKKDAEELHAMGHIEIADAILVLLLNGGKEK